MVVTLLSVPGYVNTDDETFPNISKRLKTTKQNSGGNWNYLTKPYQKSSTGTTDDIK